MKGRQHFKNLGFTYKRLHEWKHEMVNIAPKIISILCMVGINFCSCYAIEIIYFNYFENKIIFLIAKHDKYTI